MANSVSNVSFRINTNLKNQADSLFAELGMNMTTAFNIFLRQAVRERRIPFMVSADVPNADTFDALNEFYEMKKNPDAYKRYSTFSEAVKDVLSDEL